MFNTFVDIESPLLRAYNRAVSCSNILETFGQAKLEEYYGQFNEVEQKAIYTLLWGIKNKGAEVIKKQVMARVEVKD